MMRRGSSFIEVMVLLLVLAVLAPVLGRLGVEVVRLATCGGAEDRMITDRLVERIRADGPGSASVTAAAVRIGTHRWSADEAGILRDDDVVAPGHVLAWKSDGEWVTLRVQGQHGPERVIVLRDDRHEP